MGCVAGARINQPETPWVPKRCNIPLPIQIWAQTHRKTWKCAFQIVWGKIILLNRVESILARHLLLTRSANTIRTNKKMKNDIITDKAITAAMQAIEDDLRKNSCGYAKMVIIRNSLVANLRQSLDWNLDWPVFRGRIPPFQKFFLGPHHPKSTRLDCMCTYQEGRRSSG